MITKKNLCRLLFVLMILNSTGCKKILDVKADKSLSTIATLADAQALLDQTSTTETDPGAEECVTDNYYISSASYNALTFTTNRSIYTWENANLFGGSTNDWYTAYRKVYYCNSVLDALPDIAGEGSKDWNNIKGQALFKRSKSFWHITDIWSLAFDEATADTDMGIPLRLNTDFNEVSVRASVRNCLKQITDDLKTAALLLPAVPLHPVRPSKPACYAMLSRVYMAMRKYSDAKLYADSAIALFPALLDYNTVSNTPAYPFSNPNAECIYVATGGSALLTVTNAKVDTMLLSLYAANDLRKTLYFKSLGGNEYSFRGSYSNSSNHFNGLSSSEMYLNRAECLARSGNIAASMIDLNALLIKRFKTGTFVAVTAISAADALAKILTERRKELLMRFCRWMDIKRLNKEGANIILRRKVNGQDYELLPNSLRYALALPEDVLAISGMPQNPR